MSPNDTWEVRSGGKASPFPPPAARLGACLILTQYRIRNWNTLFENNRTRELKRLDWVPVPNRMDGLGYVTLMSHPNGAAHFGAWLAIIEIASRQKDRGTLPQNGAGLSHSLAVISRIPATIFDEAVPRLLDLEWMEQVTVIPQEGAGIPQEGAASRAREKGMEWKGIEVKGSEVKRILIGQYRPFLDRWAEPDGNGKVFTCSEVDLGFQIWMGLVDSGKITDETLIEVFAGLERWKLSSQWKRGFVQSVPTWLGWSKNGTPAAPRWNDRPEPAAPESEY